MHRRVLLLGSALAPLVGALGQPRAARAATVAPFTEAAFKAAQDAGKPILVFIEASRCLTCAKQRPILSKLEADPAFATLAVFDVDFDTQKDVVNAMHVHMQSTLIAFHGSKETARSVGATDPAAIRAVLEKAMA